MKAVHYIIVIAILILGVLCYLIKKEADLKTSRYSFVHPEKRNIYQTLIISGILLPKEETKIKSSISGVIEKMFIEVGDVVSQGDPLFQIQSMVDPFQLKKIENTFLLTKNIYENQQAIYDRMLELHTKNMINDDEYQRSRNDYIKAKYDFETSKSEYFFVTNNHSNKELSKLNEIKSTVKGTILDLNVSKGSTVASQNSINEGTILAVVANLESIIFKGYVLENDLKNIFIGKKVKINIGAYDNLILTGQLYKISPKGINDAGNTKFEIIIKIENSKENQQYIKPGLTATASIIVDSVINALALNEKYIIQEDDSMFVNILVNKKQIKKPIQSGVSDGIFTEIKKGLALSDKIITGKIK